MLRRQSSARAASGGGQPKYASNMGGNPTKAPRQKVRLSQKPLPRGQMAGNSPSQEARMSAYTAMMADPLNAPVVGKPDFNAVATNVSRFRDVYDVTTTAAGQAAVRVSASVPYGAAIAPTITAGAVTAWGAPTASSYSASMSADNAEYRPLCFVVQWMPTLSDMNASGRVFMGVYTTGVSDTPVQAISAYFDDEGFAASAKEAATTIVRPMGELPFTTCDIGPGNAVFGNLAFVLTGMPNVAQVVGQLVVTRIVELIPYGTTLARATAKHTPCDMHDCCTAANIVGPGPTRGWGPDSYEKTVKASLRVAKVAARLFSAYNSGGASELARLVGSN